MRVVRRRLLLSRRLLCPTPSRHSLSTWLYVGRRRRLLFRRRRRVPGAAPIAFPLPFQPVVDGFADDANVLVGIFPFHRLYHRSQVIVGTEGGSQFLRVSFGVQSVVLRPTANELFRLPTIGLADRVEMNEYRETPPSSTESIEIQGENHLKTVAPPPTAQTRGPNWLIFWRETPHVNTFRVIEAIFEFHSGS